MQSCCEIEKNKCTYQEVYPCMICKRHLPVFVFSIDDLFPIRAILGGTMPEVDIYPYTVHCHLSKYVFQVN